MIEDFDQDGVQDILLGGNFYAAKPEVGRYDASYGLFLKGDGQGNFTSIKAKDSGLKLEGQVRDFLKLTIGNKPYIIVAGNDQPLQIYKVEENYSVAAQWFC